VAAAAASRRLDAAGEPHTITISGTMSGWGVFITPDIDRGLPDHPA
jgi:hypothetical protein